MKLITTILIMAIICVPLYAAHAQYPTPLPPEPTQAPEPGVIDDDTPTVTPYFWGCYLAAGAYRCWVTVDTGYPDFDMQGFVQLLDDQGRSYVLTLYPHGYNGQLGRNAYKTANIIGRALCNRTVIAVYVTLDNTVAELHQPNNYRLTCTNQPIG